MSERTTDGSWYRGMRAGYLRWNRLSFKHLTVGIALVVTVGWYIWFLPDPLFTVPYAYVLEDRHGNLLSAMRASDGQWRFPPLNAVPEKFARALIRYEDKRFYHHIGVDVLALARALRQNIQAGRTVSGGSTITMQVVRMARRSRQRTYLEKIREILWATRVELSYTKDQILALYASHAPFGGNVVGLEAASWRYFGCSPFELSWAQAATLAVLPNAPALIYPGKNQHELRRKRDRLLERLHREGMLDAVEFQLALEEPIPAYPEPLPQLARHLLDRSVAEHADRHRIRTTIDISLQRYAEDVARHHARKLRSNRIFNVAVLIGEVETGEVLAYVGNAVAEEGEANGSQVDVIRAPRSTGSILKPLLYAAMLDEGRILPRTLLPDIPVMINGFSPKNFNRTCEGAVPADEALIRSLNIPAVLMLRDYRYEKFYDLLRKLGMTALRHPPDHYGLSLIIGGAEGTLWDIAGIYASLARMLNHAEGPGPSNCIHPMHYLQEESTTDGSASSPLRPAAVFQTFEVLTELRRPGEEQGWKNFYSAQKIAWKSGTSFGFRDGWAIGVTPAYVVGVWAGNASGEGRPGLTGTEAAAPVMFDIFSSLPPSSWFTRPYADMEQIAVCSVSGMRLSDDCTQADTMWVSLKGLQTTACSYHKRIHVTADFRYRVHRDCVSTDNWVTTSWFVLPPVQEYYYAQRHPGYRKLPVYHPGCEPTEKVTGMMEWVYPHPGARIFIPRQLNGEPGRVVFELNHRQRNQLVYWHLDGEFIGITRDRHQMPVYTMPGKHTMVVLDQSGQELITVFTMLGIQ